MSKERKPITNKNIGCALLVIVALISIFLSIAAYMGYSEKRVKTKNKIAVLKEQLVAECNTKMEKAKTTSIEQFNNRMVEAVVKLQPKVDKEMARRITTVIMQECMEKQLDPAVIVGLISVESGFNPFAESKAGAVGLMQVRYSVWKEEPELIDNGVSQKEALFWLDRNIKSGIDIFRKYYDAAECDIFTALYRYNTGSVNIPKGTRAWDIPYINKVMYNTYIVTTILYEGNICNTETKNNETNYGG